MKFTLSALPTAMMTVALMSGPIVTYASTGSDNIESSDDMTPVTVTKLWMPMVRLIIRQLRQQWHLVIH